MVYGFTDEVDTAQAAQLINDCGYYGRVEPADLAGTQLYGLLDWDKEELVACMAVLRSGAQAYVDYLVVRQDRRAEGLATYLTKQVYQELERAKVRVIHTCVSGENAASASLLKRFGAKIGWPYISATIRLEE